MCEIVLYYYNLLYSLVLYFLKKIQKGPQEIRGLQEEWVVSQNLSLV